LPALALEVIIAGRIGETNARVLKSVRAASDDNHA